MEWGVIVVPLRHRVVPGGLLGRVSSAYALLDVGGAALGSLAGGLLARGDSGVWLDKAFRWPQMLPPCLCSCPFRAGEL